MRRAPLPQPRIVADPPLVRRFRARPAPLQPRPRHEPDGWIVSDAEDGPVVRHCGPYLVAGGWWNGREVRREVVFVETAKGRVLWTFLDAVRRRWFVLGEVE